MWNVCYSHNEGYLIQKWIIGFFEYNYLLLIYPISYERVSHTEQNDIKFIQWYLLITSKNELLVLFDNMQLCIFEKALFFNQ